MANCESNVYRLDGFDAYSDDMIEDTTNIFANRNGHYRHFVVKGKDSVTVQIDME